MIEEYRRSLLKVHDSNEDVLDIHGYYEVSDSFDESNMLVKIALVFKSQELIISANDDDSLCVATKSESTTYEGLLQKSLIPEQPWKRIINKSLLWEWLLINQQGYLDGIQFELVDGKTNSSIILQLLAIGSAIAVRLVSPVKESLS